MIHKREEDRMFTGNGDYLRSLLRVQREGFVAEQVLSGVQNGNGLLLMAERWRDNGDKVNVGQGQERAPVRADVRDFVRILERSRLLLCARPKTNYLENVKRGGLPN